MDTQQYKSVLELERLGLVELHLANGFQLFYVITDSGKEKLKELDGDTEFSEQTLKGYENYLKSIV